MTGTERAAMRLALGLLRDGTFGDIVTEVLWHGGWRDLVDAYDAASDSDITPRILRARLALYLRTALRAAAVKDRYPYGDSLRPTAVVTACIQGTSPRDMRPVGDGWWLHEAITPNMRSREYEWRRWPVPLWSQAPRSKP